MLNSLSDPYLVSQYHEEYLNLINTYSNYKRSGSFIRYYNINYDESMKHPDVKSNFDSSSIKFDIYELTPTFNISPIVSATSNITDKKGQMFDGVTTISTYTIKIPRINDLITFYDPVKSGEIFRVNNIRASINAYYSDPKLTWYEMDLEVAPIKDTSELKISKHYVYDSHLEKYYNYEDYTKKTNIINVLSGKIQEIYQFYSQYNDLYLVENLVPYISNHSIIYVKDKIKTHNAIRLFNNLKKPYGFIDALPALAATYDFTQTLKVYNLTTKEIEDYVWDQNITSNLNTLLSLSKQIYDLVYLNDMYF
jgi:hypothetical protein